MALRRQFPIALLLAALALPSVAQDAEALTERLDSIREDLVELRFEKALAALQTLLGDPRMSPTDRTETWILLSQTHVAFGDLAAAEEDYRAILAMRPAFRPSVTLTPKKAMDRFEKVRKQLVGQLKIEVDPSDALLTVDGIPMHLGPDGTLSLLGGREVIIHAERDGFDSFEYPVQV